MRPRRPSGAPLRSGRRFKSAGEEHLTYQANDVVRSALASPGIRTGPFICLTWNINRGEKLFITVPSSVLSNRRRSAEEEEEVPKSPRAARSNVRPSRPSQLCFFLSGVMNESSNPLATRPRSRWWHKCRASASTLGMRVCKKTNQRINKYARQQRGGRKALDGTRRHINQTNITIAMTPRAGTMGSCPAGWGGSRETRMAKWAARGKSWFRFAGSVTLCSSFVWTAAAIHANF